MTTSTMTPDMIASRDEAVKVIQSYVFSPNTSLEGGWSVAFPNADSPLTHVFSCRGDNLGIEITLSNPRFSAAGPSARRVVGVRIYVVKHDVVVFDNEISYPVFLRSVQEVTEATNLIQDAIDEARAIYSAPYGLAALFRARWHQQRRDAEVAKKEAAAKREQMMKQRERLAAELFAIGVNDITLDHCATGEWYEDESMWAWNGALVAFIPSTSEFVVRVKPPTPDFGEWYMVGCVSKPTEHTEANRERAAASLLDLITQAQEHYRNRKKQEQRRALVEDEAEPLPPFAIGYFEQGREEMGFWINDRAEQGYASPVFTPTLGGWVYVAMRLEK
ncbi:MAG: hypothetical protein L6Q98_17680 [Anaerolineae bacterium]|nr:hypothetical protein [Anaerolineae bacterium]NUQ05962.1 hypothetical protein [Anaerolineae bacterium]